MKKHIFTFALLLASVTAANAQAVTRSSNGNFSATQGKGTTAAKDSTTTYTYTDANGKREPVYVGGKGSFYVARVAKKSGNYYRKYLKED